MADVRAALAADGPLPLLSMAAMLLTIVAPRRPTPFEPDRPAGPDRDTLLASFLDVVLVETSALLAAIAALGDDEVLARRIGRELADRGHPLPTWLTGLGGARVGRAVVMGHVLDDGDNVMLGVVLPDGSPLSVVVYIDHNMGTLVKDAFVVPEPLDALVAHMARIADDPDTTFTDLPPADARARIEQAIELAEITYPPFETDTWPACKPLVQWAARLLPPGGHGYERPEWSQEQRAELMARFLASPYGAGVADADSRSMLDSIVWFGADYGPGDPLRWSPVAVEILLADWIPRKIVADVPLLSVAPDVLRAFIRFCHAERGVRAELTADTLAAVDAHEPGYQRTIRSARPQGPAALLAALGAPEPEGGWPGPDGGFLGPEVLFAPLLDAVGGPEALAALAPDPLPDERFEPAGVPEDVRGRAVEIAALVDGFADVVGDVEYRTACRRLLTDVAAGDPWVLRRGRAETAAGALCWAVGRANDVFGGTGPQVKDLAAHFGMSSGNLSPRATTLLRAAGISPGVFGGLGTPRYLVSGYRAALLEQQARIAELS